MEFINEIRLKLGNHEHTDIAEINFGYFYSGTISGANRFFLTPEMLKQRVRSHQKKRDYYLGNYKNYQPEISQRKKCHRRTTKCWVPWYTLKQLSVKYFDFPFLASQDPCS